MKKLISIVICIVLVLSLTACGGSIKEAKTYDVESEIYTKEDITAAIETIKKEFKSNWRGCSLKEIYYAGDDIVNAHQDWADRNNADEVIVLLSSYYVGSNGGDGSLNQDYTYTNWNWILVRTSGGKWVHVDHGY